MSFLFSLLFPLVVSAADFEFDCIQNPAAKFRIIYLHGSKESKYSEYTPEKQRAWAQWAKKHKAEVAFVRANRPCSKDPALKCWAWERLGKAEVVSTTSEILQTAAKCHQSSAPLVWVGFSAGGKFVVQMLEACEQKETFVTFGTSHPMGWDTKADLSECGRYFGAIGKSDGNFKDFQSLHENLKSRKTRMQTLEFDGEHFLHLPTLGKIISEL